MTDDLQAAIEDLCAIFTDHLSAGERQCLNDAIRRLVANLP